MSEIIDSRVERLRAIYDLEAFSVAVIGIHFATVYALLCIYGLRKSPRRACLALCVLNVLSEGTQVEAQDQVRDLPLLGQKQRLVEDGEPKPPQGLIRAVSVFVDYCQR
jgi:hypothetical protein